MDYFCSTVSQEGITFTFDEGAKGIKKGKTTQSLFKLQPVSTFSQKTGLSLKGCDDSVAALGAEFSHQHPDKSLPFSLSFA